MSAVGRTTGNTKTGSFFPRVFSTFLHKLDNTIKSGVLNRGNPFLISYSMQAPKSHILSSFILSINIRQMSSFHLRISMSVFFYLMSTSIEYDDSKLPYMMCSICSRDTDAIFSAYPQLTSTNLTSSWFDWTRLDVGLGRFRFV